MSMVRAEWRKLIGDVPWRKRECCRRPNCFRRVLDDGWNFLRVFLNRLGYRHLFLYFLFVQIFWQHRTSPEQDCCHDSQQIPHKVEVEWPLVTRLLAPREHNPGNSWTNRARKRGKRLADTWAVMSWAGPHQINFITNHWRFRELQQHSSCSQ